MIQHKLGLPIVQLFSSGSLIPPKVQFWERWQQNEQGSATFLASHHSLSKNSKLTLFTKAIKLKFFIGDQNFAWSVTPSPIINSRPIRWRAFLKEVYKQKNEKRLTTSITAFVKPHHVDDVTDSQSNDSTNIIIISANYHRISARTIRGSIGRSPISSLRMTT